MTETMRAVQVGSKGGDFELVERDSQPGRGEVRVRVEACGVCHSDMLAHARATMPGVEYPRVPGHEIAGRIEAVGEDVTRGRSASGSASAGSAATAATATRAGAAT